MGRSAQRQFPAEPIRDILKPRENRIELQLHLLNLR